MLPALALPCTFVVATPARYVSASSGAATPQTKVVAHATPLLQVDGMTFKDLNKNGKLDPYEDWRLTPAERVADLLTRMTLDEKAGMMMLANHGGFIGPNGELLDQPTPAATAQAAMISPNLGDIPGISLIDRPSPRDLVLKLNVRWIGIKFDLPEASADARWSNALQEIAEGSRLGIPVALGTDPVQTTHRKPGGMPMALGKTVTLQWPDQIGFGAIGDPEVVREFGRIASAEYRAVGLSVTVSPMADTATEPRWNRIPGTFGSDAPLDASSPTPTCRAFRENTSAQLACFA